jgi:hypothetical protein
MQCTVLHLDASFTEAPAASADEPPSVEHVGDPVDLIRSKDLAVVFLYFEDLVVIWLLKC